MRDQIPTLFNRADLDRKVVALVADLPVEDKRTFKHELEQMATLSEDDLPVVLLASLTRIGSSNLPSLHF